jgi:hypothetical protein
LMRVARHGATISALAAADTAVGAFSVAGIQLYVGHRQSEAAPKAANAAMNALSAGRHTVAEFRQSWIDKVIDALSAYNAILMSIGDDHSLSPDDHWKLTALWTRLELLLSQMRPTPSPYSGWRMPRAAARGMGSLHRYRHQCPEVILYVARRPMVRWRLEHGRRSGKITGRDHAQLARCARMSLARTELAACRTDYPPPSTPGSVSSPQKLAPQDGPRRYTGSALRTVGRSGGHQQPPDSSCSVLG